MIKKVPGVMPYDPVTKRAFVNAIGSNKTEANSNITLIDIEEEVLLRIDMIDVEISFEVPDEQ